MSKGHTIVKLIKKFILRGKKKVFFGLGGTQAPMHPPPRSVHILWKKMKIVFLQFVSHFFQVHVAFNVQFLFYFIYLRNKLIAKHTHTHTHTLNYTLSPNVFNMSFWPYMKIMPHIGKYCIMD